MVCLRLTECQTKSVAKVSMHKCNRSYYNRNKVSGPGVSICNMRFMSRTRECRFHRIKSRDDIHAFGTHDPSRVEGIELRKSGVVAGGFGVFTAATTVINKGDYICIYEEEDNCPVSYEQYRNYTIQPYGCPIPMTGIMYPILHKGLGSMINSPYNSTFEENCRMVYDKDTKSVYIKAIKTIENNSELFLAYGTGFLLRKK